MNLMNFGNSSRKIIKVNIKRLTTLWQDAELSSLLLLAATVVALIWANSGFAHTYHSFWETPLGLQIGHYVYELSLHHWINDALMAIFFFVVGLEIKREFLVGELSNWQKAVLPLAAALGGMLLPALIYNALNQGGPGSRGWGIPVATDIAFALGCLAILGKRAPASLKVFLMALAVFDDLGSIFIIAVFYTPDLNISSFLAALSVLALTFALNLTGVRRTLPYALLGAVLWILTARSGIHATVAGVLLAAAIPAQARMSGAEFTERIGLALESFPGRQPELMYVSEQDRDAFEQIDYCLYEIKPPLQTIEDRLRSPAVLVIIPLFALSNAGISLGGLNAQDIFNTVSLGIVTGLVLGKQIGITLFSWLAVRMKITTLPEGVDFRHIYGVSCIAGIGYTMSLFITGLAFPAGIYTESAKLGIILASLISGAAGLLVLGSRKRQPKTPLV